MTFVNRVLASTTLLIAASVGIAGCAGRSKNTQSQKLPTASATPEQTTAPIIQDASQTRTTPAPAPVAPVALVPTLPFEYPAPSFSTSLKGITSAIFVNKLYPLQIASKPNGMLRVAFRIPQDFQNAGSSTLCNSAQLSEAYLSQVQADVWNLTARELSIDGRVNVVKITQTLAGGSSGAEKLCSTVWPEGSLPSSDRSIWESVLYNGTNVPSGSSSDPLMRSLIMGAIPGATADTSNQSISKRFLFKRAGLWQLEVNVTLGGVTQTITDCLSIPEYSSKVGNCDNP